MIFVDSMCCFGAIHVDIQESKIDFLVSSSNKCIQAVPGVAFVICNKQSLMKCKNNSKTLSLDLVDQYEVDLRCKLFRFTPPTHVILAFEQALVELKVIGGPMTRYSIIAKNHEIVYKEMTKLGFESFIPFNEQSKIVNSFLYPKDINFSFERFHNLLLDNGRVLFSRSLTSLEPTFRIGNIGHLTPSDMYSLIDVIKKILKEMDIELPLKKDYFAQE
jgi:2-aminoethylphosphonate-pyruvate transaminase